MITLIKYGITKNLGDYNSERIDAECMVGEGQCPMKAMAELKTFVTTGVLAEPTKAVVPKVEAPKEEVKEEAPAKKPKTTKPKKEEAPKEEVKEEAPAKKPKTTKPKEILYSREVKEHKAMMAAVLGDKFPTWKQDDELKARALETSQALEGTPVMDTKGAMLDSFQEKVIELMSGPEL